MKFIFLFCFSFFSMVLLSQIDHPTIESLDVSYKELNEDSDSVKLYRPQSAIVLKNTSQISIIHFKIIDASTNSIIYQADHSTSSPIVISSNGITLYRNVDNTYYVYSEIGVPLAVYLYQVSTENPEGVISEIYSELK